MSKWLHLLLKFGVKTKNMFETTTQNPGGRWGKNAAKNGWHLFFWQKTPMFWINSCCWITVWKSPWKPTDTRGIQTQQSSNICIVLMTCQLKSVYIFVPSQKELSQICTSQKYMYFLCLFFIGLFVYHWATQRFQLLSQHVKQLHLSEVTFGIQRAENVVSTVSGSWFPKSLWVGMPPPNTRCFKALCGCPNISKPKVFGSCWKTREYVRIQLI